MLNKRGLGMETIAVLIVGSVALLMHSAAGQQSTTAPSRVSKDAITDAQTPEMSRRSGRNRRRPHMTCPTSSHRRKASPSSER